MELNQLYKCALCGQVVRVEKEGAGTLVCCNQPMEKMPENQNTLGVA